MPRRKRSATEALEVVEVARVSKRVKESVEKTTKTTKAVDKMPATTTTTTTTNKPSEKKKEKATTTKKAKGTATTATSTGEDELGVHAMKVSEIKEKLSERDLSTNGDKKVLSKRLIERLLKEKDPEYKPKPKGRFCKVCVTPSLMRKRNGVRGPFFGCSNYPNCCYTESRGYAMVNNVPENWRE